MKERYRGNYYKMVREERELGHRARGGDRASRDRLILRNLDAVPPVAKMFRGRGLSFPDLLHHGRIGLIWAANHYGESRDTPFADYARWWIRRSILEALSEGDYVITLPENFRRGMYKVRVTQEKVEQERRRPATIHEITEASGLPLDLVEDALAIEDSILSLDTAVTEEGESLHEVIPDKEAEPLDRMAVRKNYLEMISNALRRLSEREAAILRLHYGLDGKRPHTHAETAQRLGISKQRAMKLEKRAFGRLQQILETNHEYNDQSNVIAAFTRSAGTDHAEDD